MASKAFVCFAIFTAFSISLSVAVAQQSKLTFFFSAEEQFLPEIIREARDAGPKETSKYGLVFSVTIKQESADYVVMIGREGSGSSWRPHYVVFDKSGELVAEGDTIGYLTGWYGAVREAIEVGVTHYASTYRDREIQSRSEANSQPSRSREGISGEDRFKLLQDKLTLFDSELLELLSETLSEDAARVEMTVDYVLKSKARPDQGRAQETSKAQEKKPTESIYRAIRGGAVDLAGLWIVESEAEVPLSQLYLRHEGNNLMGQVFTSSGDKIEIDSGTVNGSNFELKFRLNENQVVLSGGVVTAGWLRLFSAHFGGQSFRLGRPFFPSRNPVSQSAEEIGLEFETLTKEDAKRLGLDAGVLVRDVAGQAEKVGLRKADVILAVNGKPVATAKDLFEEISKMRPGSEILLKVLSAAQARYWYRFVVILKSE